MGSWIKKITTHAAVRSFKWNLNVTDLLQPVGVACVVIKELAYHCSQNLKSWIPISWWDTQYVPEVGEGWVALGTQVSSPIIFLPL